jgi:NADH-quinone oxidoreductase subunit A
MNLAGYLLLFIAVGVFFIFSHLFVAKLLRPNKPGAEKGTIYECGEPTIGSAWVQFDLRFYVVALLFVIFDVEVAFFFPWAEVFGKANAVAAYGNDMPADSQMADYGAKVRSLMPESAVNRKIIEEYKNPEELAKRLHDNPNDIEKNSSTARSLAVLAFGEIVVFFGVLLVGFAYLWRRGDLEWVRSLSERAGRKTDAAAALRTAGLDASRTPVAAATTTVH